MNIKCLWILRTSEPELPELVQAWDEFSVDDNPEGFADACADSLNRIGTDLEDHRYITIRVDWQTILDAFAPVELDGAVPKEEVAPNG